MREKFIQDLEALFERAFQQDDLRAALKAKELLGKLYGFFGDRCGKQSDGSSFSLESLSDEALDQLITRLEMQLQELPSPSPPKG